MNLIPRRLLFGNPERSSGGISPDGNWLAWIAPVGGVMNLWVAPREQPTEARAITMDVDRGVNSYGWSHDNRHLLYVQDEGGDENWHVHAVSIADGVSRDLTPFVGAQCGIAEVSRHLPGEVLISSNARDPRYHDLLQVEIATGKIKKIIENPGYAGMVCDERFVPKFAFSPLADGGLDILRHVDGNWRKWMTFDAEDARTSGPSHLDASSETLFLFDSRGRDTAALCSVSLATGQETVIAADQRADIGGAITDNLTHVPLAYSITVERQEYHVLDERIRDDIQFLADADIGDWSITSRSLDDRWWTVAGNGDVRPGRTWLYDRVDRKLELMFDTRPALAEEPLSRMHALTLVARDGLPLVCYLTLPPLADVSTDDPRTSTPQPLILCVHGGPWSRDTYGFNSQHQWLANRGYAVLNVNFRGSTGFGKTFLAAGDGEWGGRMDDDLCDAIDWAIRHGIADPARIAIMGGSYGGYAVLAAMTLHPEMYACGVDIVGPSNLETLMEAIPPYWESEREQLYRAIGNPSTMEGKASLQARSPLNRAGDICRPLLIGQGSNDPRVKQAESDQMVAAMQKHGIPVTYVVYPDEGHGFQRPPNRTSFNAFVEAFLSRHLGGSLEPLTAEEVVGATFDLRGDSAWLKEQLP